MTYVGAIATPESTILKKYDALIIGAGHNGLIGAAYLARAGLKILVLERRSILGNVPSRVEICSAGIAG